MKDALLIELAGVWELQAETGSDGLNKLHPAARETLRACADLLRMMVDAAPKPAPAAAQPAQRGVELMDLLIGPMAWMRTHVTPGGPHGPEEHDIDIHVGEDPPEDGRAWAPLYGVRKDAPTQHQQDGGAQ